ncbi:hypothetical protein Aperf_G00000000718 [Anoplocephala perfoliata]
MNVDAQLVCISGHSLHLPEFDWSVCVFVFDEHAIPARQLKPGDLVRLVNLHCRLKYDPIKRKVDMHGGGANYGRRIEVLTEETASKELLERLQRGRLKRQPINSSSLPADIELLPKMTISRIVHSSSYPAVRVRTCGRIVKFLPSRPENLHHHLLFKCGRCSRIWRLADENRRNCSCGSTDVPEFMLSFALFLEDLTGYLLTMVSVSGIKALLGPKFDDFHSFLNVYRFIAEETSRSALAVAITDFFSACVGRWVDAVLTLKRSSYTGELIMTCFHG